VREQVGVVDLVARVGKALLLDTVVGGLAVLEALAASDVRECEQDYYQEGELLWLDADTLIRQLTDDKKSLTDFLQIFLAKGGDTGPLIVTYNRQELIDDLNQVVKYDWAKFLHDRVDLINPHADLEGITRGGYKLVYQDHPSDTEKMAGGGRRMAGPNVWYSLGLRISAEGTISDVRWGGPADQAKLAPRSEAHRDQRPHLLCRPYARCHRRSQDK